METKIFKQYDISVLHRRNGSFCTLADHVFGKHHRNAEFGKSHRNGTKRVFQIERPLRTSEMRTENDFCSVIAEIIDCRKSADYPVVVGHLAVFIDRNVEVHTDKTTLAFYVYVCNSFFVHDISPSSRGSIS